MFACNLILYIHVWRTTALFGAVDMLCSWALGDQQEWQEQQDGGAGQKDEQSQWLPRRVVHNPIIK